MLGKLCILLCEGNSKFYSTKYTKKITCVGCILIFSFYHDGMQSVAVDLQNYVEIFNPKFKETFECILDVEINVSVRILYR